MLRATMGMAPGRAFPSRQRGMAGGGFLAPVRDRSPASTRDPRGTASERSHNHTDVIHMCYGRRCLTAAPSVADPELALTDESSLV